MFVVRSSLSPGSYPGNTQAFNQNFGISKNMLQVWLAYFYFRALHLLITWFFLVFLFNKFFFHYAVVSSDGKTASCSWLLSEPQQWMSLQSVSIHLPPLWLVEYADSAVCRLQGRHQSTGEEGVVWEDHWRWDEGSLCYQLSLSLTSFLRSFVKELLFASSPQGTLVTQPPFHGGK